METKEKVFGDGIWFDRPSPNAPSFVKGKLSVNVRKFKDFLDTYTNEKGYCNLDLLESKAGDKLYFSLNTYVAKMEKPEGLLTDEEKRRIAIARGEGSKGEIRPDDIPF